ncbi:TylF/MycF family methyltransferase [Paenibacillus radicis (ex Gao et al. 2016)]|uniref:Macrocin O-methyltransferase n=1 Tax=Paenibacillus radicis (ex Gao et al. 2016) TaxID=1737354 RepID=A0A917GWQ2_9BACL|nr:TylF/MycF family methyltransferase [Paenibacillus radicis (ex Gao et al. 2016)]GGG58727.1 macrocin O-methyltransferase [Paenibacillus radicis (ex Gao et al. 2016)]
MTSDAGTQLYLELLKKTILFEIWLEHEGGNATPTNRWEGLDWPNIAHSMIGRLRMNQLHEAMDTVLREGIPGDFIETGVWRGGACIFMRGFLKAHGMNNRRVFVADSFEGLPVPDPQYPIDATSTFHTQDFLRVSLPEVKNNFRKYGLLDRQVTFLKGWFKDTLPVAPITQLAIARLDGDMYSSTMDSLNNLYPKLSIGGFLIVDDYSIGYCAAAVHDFRAIHNITDPIIPIDITGIYWRKTK